MNGYMNQVNWLTQPIHCVWIEDFYFFPFPQMDRMKEKKGEGEGENVTKKWMQFQWKDQEGCVGACDAGGMRKERRRREASVDPINGMSIAWAVSFGFNSLFTWLSVRQTFKWIRRGRTESSRVENSEGVRISFHLWLLRVQPSEKLYHSALSVHFALSSPETASSQVVGVDLDWCVLSPLLCLYTY